MNKIKRTVAVLLGIAVLTGCTAEAVQANTMPAAAYVTDETTITTTVTTTTEKPVLTTTITEGVTAAPVTSPEETTVKTTTEATTEKTTASTTSVAITTAPKVTTRVMTAPKTTTTAKREPKPVKYTNTITLLGPNVVYTGESFKFTYKISHRNAERASVLWQMVGGSGKLYNDGTFEATAPGIVTLKVSDISNGLSDTLEVHVVDSPEDIDFVCEVNGIPIANKTYPVPKDHNPGLLTETYDAFMELKQAAYLEGIEINFMSGFRSYQEQVEVYHGWNDVYSEQADRVSARPGHSEHQLGLAIDVNSIEFTFADTPEGLWLAENCWKYGFIIRYKEGTEHITGYMYEPWHIRYLGDELAEEVHFSGLTLEEYLGIDSRYRIEEYHFEDEE